MANYNFYHETSHSMNVCDGELLLLKALKLARETPNLDEDQIYYITTKALKIMVKVTKGLNREWHANEEVWSLVYCQMEHCHSIFRQLLVTLQKRFLGESLLDPVVADIGVQTQSNGDRCDASTSTREDGVVMMNDEVDGAVGGATCSQVVARHDEDVVMLDSEYEEEDWTEWDEDERYFQRVQQVVDVSDLVATAQTPQASQDEVSVSDGRPPITRNRNGVPNCWICNLDHAVHACNKFLRLTKADRFKLLAAYDDVCHNCFCFGHVAERCWKPDGCRCNTHRCQCGAKHGHNSTICAGKRCYRPY